MYFAKKIRGAVAIAQGKSGDSKDYMQEALGHWEEMIRLHETHNLKEIPDMQTSDTFSWRNQLNTVRNEAN